MKKIILSVLLILSANSYSHIAHEGTLCQSTNEMCFYSWPELPKVKGWKQDVNTSRENEINAQVPEGKDFNTAEAVIYAKAAKVTKNLKIQNVSEFIAQDQEGFKKHSGIATIVELSPIENAVHVKMRCFSFKPIQKGNWELVTYGEETDSEGQKYFTTFVLTSKSEAGLNSNLAVYKEFISKYK